MNKAATTPAKRSFENSEMNPRHDGSQVFLRDGWESLRDSGIAPLHGSALSDDADKRAEFLRGAELLGLGTRRMPELVPQMLTLADTLAAEPRFAGVLEPRRSSKTTSLFAVAMGRIASRPGYLVSYTMATTAIKARTRFRQDIKGPLEAKYRGVDAKDLPFKINNAGGSESVTWFHDDGSSSILQFLAPKGEAFRSDSWDLIIIDEGGEADPAMSEDLIAGCLATMDTRPGATLVIAGTAGEYRAGNLLWDTLEDGRVGANRTGILEYAAPADTKRSQVDTWEKAKPILLATHPGIGTLTDIETMESNYIKLSKISLEQFMREYLSIFSKVGGSSFIDQATWGDRAVDALPTPPAHFRFAYAVHPLQSSASIVAAWRVDDVPHGLVLEHKQGVAWVEAEVLRLYRKHRVPIATDVDMSMNTAVDAKLQRAKPKPKFYPLKWAQVSTAAATLYAEMEDGSFVHYDQAPLNEAVRLAVKRATQESKRWGFGRGQGAANEANDITPLEAWSNALAAYDASKPRVPVQIVTG